MCEEKVINFKEDGTVEAKTKDGEIVALAIEPCVCTKPVDIMSCSIVRLFGGKCISA